jgi:hypothetical protein
MNRTLKTKLEASLDVVTVDEDLQRALDTDSNRARRGAVDCFSVMLYVH